MEPKYLLAEQIGIRLESVGGLHIWEAQPTWKHQKAVDRIRASIQVGSAPACTCVHAAGVYVAFADGSLKRPDISIFCREPDEDTDAITLLPEAVIEVVSKGYEAKDLEIGPNFLPGAGGERHRRLRPEHVAGVARAARRNEAPHLTRDTVTRVWLRLRSLSCASSMLSVGAAALWPT